VRGIYRRERAADRGRHPGAGKHADAVWGDPENRLPARLPPEYIVLFDGTMHAIAYTKPVTNADTESKPVADRHGAVSDSICNR